jgi:5'-3' exonuclease
MFHMTVPRILCIDAYNLLHRSRSGFKLGPAPVAFNFFRSLRALVAQFEPTRVYFVTEGIPKHRLAIDPEYKANRAVEPGTDKARELAKFHDQKNEILKLLQHFPVSIIRHPDFEADDTIHNLLCRASFAVEWVVLSNDSDFTQLLNTFSHVKLYNPMKKAYVEKPAYNYVAWKALRGDPTDNIPGIPGIGDKRAEDIITDPRKLSEFVKNDEHRRIFLRNRSLIMFHTWSDEEAMQMTSSAPTHAWDVVKAQFDTWGFRSMTNDVAWEKFVSTFEPLWGQR